MSRLVRFLFGGKGFFFPCSFFLRYLLFSKCFLPFFERAWRRERELICNRPPQWHSTYHTLLFVSERRRSWHFVNAHVVFVCNMKIHCKLNIISLVVHFCFLSISIHLIRWFFYFQNFIWMEFSITFVSILLTFFDYTNTTTLRYTIGSFSCRFLTGNSRGFNHLNLLLWQHEIWIGTTKRDWLVVYEVNMLINEVTEICKYLCYKLMLFVREWVSSTCLFVCE